MSFKLFFLSTFKGLKNTAKVEAKHDALWSDYLQYRALLGSEELKKYQELEQLVGSEAFKKEKKSVNALKFKGSHEARIGFEFGKLEKNPKLKGWYVTDSSADFRKFNELNESDDIRRFIELRDYVQSKKYETEKAKFKAEQGKGGSGRFEETDAHRKFEAYQTLSKSKNVLFWEEYPKSKAYKEYQSLAGSPLLKRFEELKGTIAEPEFKTRVDFLKDSNRWQRTEMYQHEKTYLELQKQPQFRVYEKYKKPDALAFYLNYDLVLEDHFDGGKLDTAKWSPVHPVAASTLGRNFSKAGDLQAFTEGANVSQTNSNLKLTVKKEKTESMVWNFPIGFSPVNLDYSAGLLCSNETFRIDEGVLEAKIRFQPNKKLVDLFYLADDQNSFRINLLEAGTVSRLGMNAGKDGKHESLAGLSAGQFYVFRVEWSKGTIRWSINNNELYSAAQNVPDRPMRINMSSIVVDAPGELPHFFEVDWVRLYRKK